MTLKIWELLCELSLDLIDEFGMLILDRLQLLRVGVLLLWNELLVGVSVAFHGFGVVLLHLLDLFGVGSFLISDQLFVGRC